MLHAVLDELRKLLSLGASIQVEPLLGDALCLARGLVVLPAQPPRPLHALLPQQRVLRLVAGGGVPVGRLLLPGLSVVAVFLALICADGCLGLQEGWG